MFTSVLFLLVAFTSSQFDRYERIHSNLKYCDDSVVTRTFELDSDQNKANRYIDCKTIGKVSISPDSFGLDGYVINDYLFSGSSVSGVSFSEEIPSLTINEGAFSHCSSLTSFSFPNIKGSIIIKDGAFFKCDNLDSITFPLVTSSIGESAFELCTKLKPSFNLEETTTRLEFGKYAFYNCDSIGQISLPKASSILDHCFDKCKSLEISNVVATSIGNYAFYGCKFTDLTIDCVKVGLHALDGTGSIKKFVQNSGCKFDSYSFKGLSLPNPLEFKSCTFSDYTFAGCSLLNVEVIDFNTIAIPKYCFKDTQNLNEATVNLHGCSIGAHAFENTGIFELKLDMEESTAQTPLTISEYAFYKSGLKGNLIIPSYYSTIETRAFAQSGLNQALTIDHVGTIGSYAFQNCPITGPVRIIGSKIGESSFEGCNSFTELVIGEENTDLMEVEFKTIEKRAFYGVKVTGSLYIHSSIDKIEEYAFSNAQMSSVNVNIFAGQINPFAFANAGTINNLNIYSETVYFHAFDGCTITNLVIDYKDPLMEENPDPRLEEQAFYGLTITNLDISNEYTICQLAFSKCNFRGSLKIDSKKIDSYAFSCCESLSSCTVDIGDCDIQKFAFMNFSSISRLTFFGEGECTIGEFAFNGAGITNNNAVLAIPSTVSKIDKYAFANIITLSPSSLSIACSQILEGAFEGCSGITEFEFKEGVTQIGSRAFYGTSLKGPLVVPKTVSTIGVSAFENLNKLGEITIYSDSALTSIGPLAFCLSSISGSLQIPSSVTSIGSSAFLGCTGLRSLLFYYNGNLNTIGDYAFTNCTNLNCNLDIPSKVASIGDYAFTNCTSIQGHLTLHLGCQVGLDAFTNCNLDSIAIKTDFSDSNIFKIKPNSFMNLNVFGSIKIPDQIYEIGDSAFEGCKDIGSVTFDGSSRLRRIGNRAFYHSGINDDFVIPNTVEEIGTSAFEGCEKLSSITFNENDDNDAILDIGAFAFYCTAITSLTLPKQTNLVGDYAFANCTQFTGFLTINSGVLGIGVFENCTNLRYASNTISLSNTYIGSFALRGCNNFVSTIILRDGCKLGESSFEGLITPGFSISITASTENSVEIGNRAFYGSSLKGSLGITSAISYVGREAFAHCTQINGSLTIGTSDIRDGAFSYSSFKDVLSITVNLGNSFSENTFRGCYGFSSLNIEGLESVPARAFYGMSFFKGTLTIPSVTKSIGEYAFAGCGFSQVSFEERDSEVDIQRGAFSGIPEMIGITFPEKSQTPDDGTRSAREGENTKGMKIRDFMFYECTSLNSFTIPADYSKIGNYAFYGCSNLVLNLNFEKITSIGEGAFQGCSSLRGPLLIPSTLTEIKENAFAGCTGLTGSLIIRVNGKNSNNAPDLQTYIGAEAFKGCKGFNKGTLSIFVENNEEVTNYNDNYYNYGYFLRIGHDAFEDCKFKNIYYNGRFQPDCDYDLGFSHTKAIHTSSNYANKTFCSYPLHKDKLSGGAIAGITIAVIIVVAAIVVLVVFLILRMKKNKDQSENEVEMNADP